MKKYKPNRTRIANKILALAFLIPGVIITIMDHDLTFLIMMSVPATYLFFSKEKIIF